MYKAAVVNSHQPAPPSLANLTATIQQMARSVAQILDVFKQMAANLAEIRQLQLELPIVFANLQAGDQGPLRNPTASAGVWAPLLVAPNPTNKDELLGFTSESP